MAESMVGLVITFLGVMSLALIVGDGRKNEQLIENKTDRAYAWHVMKKNDLREIEVHDHTYKLVGNKKIYDVKENETYQLKN